MRDAGVSSDPLKDLSDQLLAVSDAFEVLITDRWAAGSPASRTADDLSLVDQWSDTPGQDAILTINLLGTSILDHLRALAHLIVTPRIVLTLATVSRGGLEAIAQAHYLADPEIDIREQVRRHMNLRLNALHEQTRLLEGIARPGRDNSDLVEKLAKIEVVLSSARRQSFRTTKAKRHKQPYIGTEPPSVMSLIEEAVSGTKNSLGATYYRWLSGVAHSQPHGLVGHAIPILDPEISSADGYVKTEISITPKALAVRHMGVLLAIAPLIGRLCRLYDRPDHAASHAVKAALLVWGRVAEVDSREESALVRVRQIG